MLAAAAPFVRRAEWSVGCVDPVSASTGFYASFRDLLRTDRVRAVCISTSTAAVEEAARVARMVAEFAPGALVVAGGPHEDDCSAKLGMRLPGVHLSIGGTAEFALDYVLSDWLGRDERPSEFSGLLPSRLRRALPPGRFTVASPHFTDGSVREVDGGPVSPDLLTSLILPDRLPTFDVFHTPVTVPLMISRGCPYGKCTFCAESIRGDGFLVHDDFDWIPPVLERWPEAALYFQDSIFPMTKSVRGRLLPILKELAVPWGAQAYLRTLTHRTLDELADHGCSYVYTGVESASSTILAGLGKSGLGADLVLEKASWFRDAGIRLGISLMFGSMAVSGELLETPETVQRTVDLAEQIRATGAPVAGFYPNVQTVLPGTALARGLARAGVDLDFYRVPKSPIFDTLEDGGVGYNFLTCRSPDRLAWRLANRIREAARQVSGSGSDAPLVEDVLEGTFVKT